MKRIQKDIKNALERLKKQNYIFCMYRKQYDLYVAVQVSTPLRIALLEAQQRVTDITYHATPSNADLQLGQVVYVPGCSMVWCL
jgi:hypothetical protein